MIKVQDLTKHFGTKRAVDGISFTVELGEVLGFLGPNGAGKSTTMRMLTGFIPPTGGSVTIGDFDMVEDPIPAKKLIGYLPENAPAYTDMTVLGFLNFAAEIRGLRGGSRAKAVNRAVEMCFLESVLHQSVDTLSKGYRHRTCFAQSVIHDPDILVLDEPTDGLDPNQKHEVRQLIRRMGEKKAIIFSTHILEEVDAACSSAIIIDRGKIVANGTPAELRRKSEWAGAVTLRVSGVAAGAVREKLNRLRAAKRVATEDQLQPRRGHGVSTHGGRRRFDARGHRGHERLAGGGIAHGGRPAGRSLPQHHDAGHERTDFKFQMNSFGTIKTIAKRELLAYFSSPVAYVFIVIFLLLNGFFTFMVGGFFERGEASLTNSFFVWHPWFYLFLVPAVGMRLWADERRVGTLELLLTMPIAPWEAIVGKFIASWLFLGLALELTFPVVLTVNHLGSPDNGVIFSAYVGSWLMAGAYLAVSCITSAITRSQVVSFIVSVVACLFLILAGFPPVINLLQNLTHNWQWLVDTITSFSVITHFDGFEKGVLDSRDVIFFLSVIGFSLFATSVILRTHRAS